MANAAVTRCEIQIVFDDGAYVRLQSRKGGVTHKELRDLLNRALGFLDAAARKGDRDETHDRAAE